jgi:hypothetical protein
MGIEEDGFPAAIQLPFSILLQSRTLKLRKTYILQFIPAFGAWAP